MKKVILAATVLAPVLAMPAMADISQGNGAMLPLSESASGFFSDPAHTSAHVPAAARHGLKPGPCPAYEDSRDDVYPFECEVGTRSNGSEGGSGEGGADSSGD
jgi:hypothetical protein